MAPGRKTAVAAVLLVAVGLALGAWLLGATQPPGPQGRLYPSTTLMADGRVLVAGGEGDDGQPLASVAIYDPVANTWRSASRMHGARVAHGAVLLSDGRVMVMGGFGRFSIFPIGGRWIPPYLDSAEIYDPASDRWTAVRSMPSAFGPVTASLADGRVVARDEVMDRTFAYELTSGLWHAVPATSGPSGYPVIYEDNYAVYYRVDRTHDLRIPSPKDAQTGYNPIYQYTSVRLHDGRVLVAGGERHGAEKRTVIVFCGVYDPTSNTWSDPCPYRSPRSVPALVVLRDGSVLMFGGYGVDRHELTAERFDLQSTRWSSAGDVP